MCETAVWSEWVYGGTAVAMMPCQVLAILGDAEFLVSSTHYVIIR